MRKKTGPATYAHMNLFYYDSSSLWTNGTVKNGVKDFKKFATRTPLWSVSLPDNTGKLNTALSARCQAATNLLCRNTPASKSLVSFIF